MPTDEEARQKAAELAERAAQRDRIAQEAKIEAERQRREAEERAKKN